MRNRLCVFSCTLLLACSANVSDNIEGEPGGAPGGGSGGFGGGTFGGADGGKAGSAVGGPVDGPKEPVVLGKGILDCPAVAAPAYSLVPAGGKLSVRFQTTCAGCHGSAGKGRPGYPALPGTLTLEQYTGFVRNGKGVNMAAFDEAAMSDAEIKADFAILQNGDNGSDAVANGRTDPSTWSQAKREEILAKGLKMLRTPDKYGTACVNCHSPDAIELAVIAFSDDDILRRGLQHLKPDAVMDIVDYVHALRAKHKISQPCSKLWRPLQPGGEPLPGDSAEEREIAFAQELKKRELLVATKPIKSLEDALAASAQLEALNLRTLPVGVVFPRWSEDAFNGDAHRSFDDWMPGAGRVPKNPAEFYALHDKYLADPTIDNLAVIDAALKGQTMISQADSHGRKISDDYTATYNAEAWVEQVLLIKHQSVLMGGHFFRMALMEKPSWYDLPALPFPALNRQYNPFFHQGLVNAESPCYSNKLCDQEVAMRMPEFMKEELGGVGPSFISTSILSDPWSYLGQMLDQSLLTAENSRGSTHDGHYWNLFTFKHRFVQQPFYSAHRITTQEAYFAKHRGTEKYPATLEAAANSAHISSGWPTLPDEVHPMLSGKWMDIQGLETPRRGEDDSRSGPSIFLRSNIARMLAFQQRALLKAGAPVHDKARLLERIRKFRAPSEHLSRMMGKAGWADGNPLVKENVDLFTKDSTSLFDEVDALIGAAGESN